MIIFYRTAGLLLLFGSGCSVVSLLGRIDQFFLPSLIIFLVLAGALGAMGAIVYKSKSAESTEWLVNLSIIAAIAIFCFIGGLIQWA